MQYRVSNLVVFLHPSFGGHWGLNWSSSLRSLFGLLGNEILNDVEEFLKVRFALAIVVALAGCTLSWGRHSSISASGDSSVRYSSFRSRIGVRNDVVHSFLNGIGDGGRDIALIWCRSGDALGSVTARNDGV